MKSIYLIGALKNSQIPVLGNELRALGLDVFEDWYSPGPDTDTYLYEYEKQRGHNYKQALKGYAAQHNFRFDKFHLDRCDGAIMYMPCGKSAHLELGYVIGSLKPGYILFDAEPERFDLMYSFATDIFFEKKDLFKHLEDEFENDISRCAVPTEGTDEAICDYCGSRWSQSCCSLAERR